MNSHDRKYIDVSRTCALHNQAIPACRSAPEREFDELVELVFSHQKAVYFEPDHTKPRLVQIAKFFYEHCYLEPTIKLGLGDGASVSTTEFLDKAINAKGDNGRNMVFYLLGDVGVGKTAFLNAIISKHLKDHVEKGEVFFLRFDLDQITGNAFKKSHELVEKLAEKALRILESNPALTAGNELLRTAYRRLQFEYDKSLDDSSTDPRNMSTVSILKAFREMVDGIRIRTGRRLVLVIDDIDYLLHKNDRGLFRNPQNSGDVASLEDFYHFVRYFLPDGEFGRLGANIFIVTRHDSYRTLSRASTSLPDLVNKDDLHTYTLKPPQWADVLQTRSKLLKFASSLLPEERKRSDFERLADIITKDLETGIPENPKLIEHMKELTNFGLREVMAFFAQYGWISDSGDRQLDNAPGRFVHQYPVALLTYILGRKRRYSQFLSQFPNIYLVRMIGLGGSDYETLSAKESEHPHSYWLKWLICSFLRRTPLAQDRSGTDPQLLFDVFCRSEGHSYSERLVQECLGSLTDANYSNMIIAEREPHPERKDVLILSSIRLTPRGEHCMRFIFDRFLYLQLVVDDYMLPLPKSVAQDFSFKNQIYDYSYVIEPQPSYGQKANTMIHLKARQVLLFASILELALTFEQKRYAGVFARLRDEGVELPSFNSLRSGLKRELDALKVENLDAIEEWVRQKRAGIESDLRNTILEQGPFKGTN
jgi:KAP family P-loop domain